MSVMEPLPVVLTIAGSDSGGGAGIQADLKAMNALGCHGTSAITCVTAQNPDAVTGVESVSADMVRRQIDAVCDGFPVAAAKTGMLYSAELIRAVAQAVRERAIPNLVVDPVMVATSGAKLLRDDAAEAMCEALFPQADVITPNIPEAEALSGHVIASRDALEAAAIDLSERFGTACTLKGGHLAASAGDDVVDVLALEGETYVFTSARVPAHETHGTGCTFAAAVASLLARGNSLPEAVKGAQAVVAGALRNARPAGSHFPLVPTPPVADGVARAHGRNER
jgi:hydroxymethylpyrimidine/phosphomethylpyrimidine kinase